MSKYLTPQLKSFLHHRVVQTLVLIGLFLVCAEYLPPAVFKIVYTISLVIKDLLMWILPFTVCFYIASSLTYFKKNAIRLLAFLLVFEAISNASSLWYAYSIGQLMWPKLVLNPLTQSLMIPSLEPYFSLKTWRPSFWTIDKGTFIGPLLGLFSALRNVSFHFIEQGRYYGKNILTQFFGRLIPFFVLGFIANLYSTKQLPSLLSSLGQALLWILGGLVFYIMLLFCLAAKGNFKIMITSIKNLMPAGLTALTTSCSSSTMPLTIAGCSRNVRQPQFAQMIIPATTNIQQIGDCIVNALLCLVVLKQFNFIYPSLMSWFIFSVIFTLARFATAAVMGGAIFLMLPIYEKYLGFNTEMCALMLALNVILDPIVTSTNVMANGALCQIFENIWLWFNSKFDRNGSQCDPLNFNISDPNLSFSPSLNNKAV